MCHVSCGWFAKIQKSEEKSSNAKNHWNGNNRKTYKGMWILAIYSLTRSLQSTGKQVFRDGTDRQQPDIATESTQRVDSVELVLQILFSSCHVSVQKPKI